MVIKNQKVNKLELFGKKIRTDKTFKNQTKVNRFELASYKKEIEPIRYFYNEDTRQILKMNIKDENPKVKYGQVFRDWGIHNMPAKKVIKSNEVLKNQMVILNKMNFLYDNDAAVKLIIKLRFQIQISDGEITRYKTVFYDGAINDIISTCREFAINYLQPFGFGLAYRNQIIQQTLSDIEIMSDLKKGIKFNMKDMRMREAKPLNICNLYNNVITMEETEENCVKKYLKIAYTKIACKKIDSMGDESGVTTNEMNDFCKKYNIKMLMYNIGGEIISSFYPKIKNKSYKSLVGIAYNNHFYPVKNTILNSVSIPSEIKIKLNLNIEFDKLLKKRILPSNIKLIKIKDTKNEFDILTFNHDKKQYIRNSEYDICLDILDKFGLKDKITPFTNLHNISNVIEKLYSTSNINSFFIVNYSKGGFNYFNKKIDMDDYDDFITIDHNKCYSNCLHDLEFLISVDMRQAKFIKFDSNPEFVIEHYLYIAKPKKSSLLLPHTNIYSGKHLLFCTQEGLEFDVTEELATIKHDNFYTQMVSDMFKNIDAKYIKDIVNIMIGNFESKYKINQSIEVEKICNFQERMTNEGFYYKYKEDTFFKLKSVESISNIYNRCPIAILIKDLARMKLYNKINSLKLSNNDLIAIETDSISFINQGQKLNLDTNNWRGWKQIVKPLKWFNEKRKTYSNYAFDEVITFELPNKINNNKLYNCYAGSGKTYTILNDIIPKIENSDYIIITPCHNAAKEYYKRKLNCKVIQTFKYQNNIPKETYIIIDEIGLCDREGNNFIYKCFLMGKTIYSFGDYRQLLPIYEKKHFDSINYLNHIYSEIIDIRTNYRNQFTIEYYDELIKCDYKDSLSIEIKKYNSDDYTKADIIICITIKQKDIYNKLMSKHLKKTIYDIGCKIVCVTNNLRSKEIYNNFDFIIKDIQTIGNELFYILDDGVTDKYITVNYEELTNNFELGYAITLFKAQGQEYKSFFMPECEFKYINGRSAYTLISRLKTTGRSLNEKVTPKVTKKVIANVYDKLKNESITNWESF